MKYLFIIVCSLIITSQKKCKDKKTPIMLHFTVVEAITKAPIQNAQIGNYIVEGEKQVFEKKAVTDTQGYTQIAKGYKKVQGQPFVYNYEILKKGYQSKNINFNTHQFVSEDAFNIKLDTIFLIPFNKH